MNLYYYILLGVVILVYPLYCVFSGKKTYEILSKNDSYRLLDYKRTLLIFWILTTAIVVFYYLNDNLGFILSVNLNISFFIFLGCIIFYLVSHIFIVKKIKKSDAEKLKNEYGIIYSILPKNINEYKWSIFLAISAGICEEIIFRLFLFNAIIQYTGIIIAGILVNIIFAITHYGSGNKNLIGSFMLGLIFTLIYYLTGSIWLSIILHALIDIFGMTIGYKTFKLLK